MSAAAEELARITGRTVPEAELAIAQVSTRVRPLVAAGQIVRQHGQRAEPTEAEIAGELALVHEIAEARRAREDAATKARGAIFAAGAVPAPALPPFRRRGLR